jgi:ABC-type transport system involved in cytochrome c biogenesis permease subunit
VSPTLKKILAPIASLRLTLALLGLAMVLIFAGTTVQSEMSVWDVQHHFFHSWITKIDLRLFFPLSPSAFETVPGAIAFPGGYTLIVLLLANLLAAHIVRFKIGWNRAGILIIHAGLILLLVGEVITAENSIESQMTIDVGGSANFAADSREAEIAVIDSSNPEHDTEIIIPIGRLQTGAVIQSPKLPFAVEVKAFHRNSDVAGPRQTDVQAQALATVGAGIGLKLVGLPPANGTDSSVDFPSAYATLTAGAQSLGTYLLSTIPLPPQFPQINSPQKVVVDGKEYQISLRFRRYYKPYTVHLLQFSHDRYTGTDKPRNFSSRVRVVDPADNLDREVLIWMNHPFRYAGETFYQASFKPGDQTSILQVVRNPGWLIPYISCSMVGLGMILHFGLLLLKFLSRVGTMPQVDLAVIRGRESDVLDYAGGTGNGAGTAVLPKSKTKAKAAALSPLVRTKAPAKLAAIVTGICLLYLLSGFRPASNSGAFDLREFSRIPILFEGRTMPLDSLANNSLRILSGKSTFLDGVKTRTAIEWLADVFGNPERAADYKVFRIDHPDIKSLLGAPDTEKLFSLRQIGPSFGKLQDQFQLARKVPQAKRDSYQRQILELTSKVQLLNQLMGMEGLYLSPPMTVTEWRQLGPALDAVQSKGIRDPGAESIVAMLGAIGDNKPDELASLTHEYRLALEQKLPADIRRIDLEVLFNRFDPFIKAMALYVIVFLLASFSWLLQWRGSLVRAALWVLVLALVVHTFGLGARMYIQQRPPVTNLYSSAIFIAWVTVGFCVVMEMIFRNGVPSAAAAAVAFPTLLIAHYLAGDGDTMKMLEAVLDTNIWLATHVVVVTMGYAATFLAGFLAIAYVLLGLLTPALNADLRKNFYRMVYGVICFAMLFSFVGTILGGIWADQSWGRFWGWDPKENGAVLIVLWNAIVLHARWSGIVRERGFMNLAIFGNVVTAWSWFGTNMLGVGLHSYGFMESAAFWLVAFVGLQIAIMAIGCLPLNLWRSYNTQSALT